MTTAKTKNTTQDTNITALQTTVSEIPSKYVDLKTTQKIAGQKTFTDWAHFGPLDCASIFSFSCIYFRSVTNPSVNVLY